jgi:excisionase family DNA binding protein
VSRATAYRLVESGELPAVKVGGSIRICREALLSVLAFRVPDEVVE